MKSRQVKVASMKSSRVKVSCVKSRKVQVSCVKSRQVNPLFLFNTEIQIYNLFYLWVLCRKDMQFPITSLMRGRSCEISQMSEKVRFEKSIQTKSISFTSSLICWMGWTNYLIGCKLDVLENIFLGLSDTSSISLISSHEHVLVLPEIRKLETFREI